MWAHPLNTKCSSLDQDREFSRLDPKLFWQTVQWQIVAILEETPPPHSGRETAESIRRFTLWFHFSPSALLKIPAAR